MPKAINSFQMWGELFVAIFIGRCYSTVLWQESFDLLVTTCLKKGRGFSGQIDIFYAFLKTEHFCIFEKLFTDCVQPDSGHRGGFSEERD